MANGVAVCGSCGREVQDDEAALPPQAREKGPDRDLYAIIAVLLVVLCVYGVLR